MEIRPLNTGIAKRANGVQNTWTGGLNVADAVYAVKDDELTDGQNMLISDVGVPYKSFGTRDLTTAPKTYPVVGAMDFYTGSVTDTNVILVAVAGGLYSFNDTTGVFTLLATGIDTAANGHFETFKYTADNDNMAVFVDGVNTPKKISSALVVTTLGGSPPATGSLVSVFKDRLWMSVGYELTASDVGNSESGWSVSFNIGSREFPITGLIQRYDRLLIFKQNEIHALLPGASAGLETAEVDVISTSIGCGAAKSIVETSFHTLVWIGGDKRIYAMEGERPRWISRNVQSILDTIPSEYLQNACAVQYGDYYRIAITDNTSTTNNIELFLNLPVLHRGGQEQWSTKRIGRDIGCYLPLVNEGRDRLLYYGDSKTGRICQADYEEYTDFGSDITAQMQTKLYSLGGDGRHALHKKAHIRTKGNGAITLSAVSEAGDLTSVGTVAAQTTGPFGDELTFAELALLTFADFSEDYRDSGVFFPAGYRHRLVGLKVSEASDKPFSIFGVEIDCDINGARR